MGDARMQSVWTCITHLTQVWTLFLHQRFELALIQGDITILRSIFAEDPIDILHKVLKRSHTSAKTNENKNDFKKGHSTLTTLIKKKSASVLSPLSDSLSEKTHRTMQPLFKAALSHLVAEFTICEVDSTFNI